MNLSVEWQQAIAVNGQLIDVQLIPLMRSQNTTSGFVGVEVGKMIELRSGEKIDLNLDGRSFYIGLNQLYKLI
ncbi:transposase [Acinetobacter sp. GXMZU3951]